MNFGLTINRLSTNTVQACWSFEERKKTEMSTEMSTPMSTPNYYDKLIRFNHIVCEFNFVF